MISQDYLELMRIKEANYDFVEVGEDAPELSPINRPIARVTETAQLTTFLDLCKVKAELDVQITHGETDLSPKVFKLKCANLKTAMQNSLEEKKKLRQQYEDEIKIIEDKFDINTMESEYQQAIQKKLQEEEALKANQSIEWAEQEV